MVPMVGPPWMNTWRAQGSGTRNAKGLLLVVFVPYPSSGSSLASSLMLHDVVRVGVTTARLFRYNMCVHVMTYVYTVYMYMCM